MTGARPVAILAVLVILTSAVGYSVGMTVLRRSRGSLTKAALRTLETVGVAAVFFGANIVAGMLVVMLWQGVTGRFVSPYVLNDVGLLGLSVLQGILFAWWSSD